LGAERVGRDQECGWHLVGVLAERHVGEVEQPPYVQIARLPFEVCAKLLHGLARSRFLHVDSRRLERKNAARWPKALKTVFDLSARERGDAQENVETSLDVRRNLGSARECNRPLQPSRGFREFPLVHIKKGDCARLGNRLDRLLERRRCVKYEPIISR